MIKELRFNILFSKYLLNKDDEYTATLLNESFEYGSEDNKIVFLSQLINNTIQTYTFNQMQDVEQYIFDLIQWLRPLSNLQSAIDIEVFVLGIKISLLLQLKFINSDTLNTLVEQFISNIDKINNTSIKNIFIKYLLDYYINNDLVLQCKDTVDKIIQATEKLENLNDQGYFKLPRVEKKV